MKLILFSSLLLFIFIFTTIKYKTLNLISPIFWLYISWLFLFIIYFFSGINYTYKIQFNSFIYIFISFILFGFFYFFGLKFNSKIRNKTSHNSRVLSVNLIFYFSILGWFIWIFEVFRLNDIVFGQRINDFSISILGLIGYLFLDLSLLVWIFYLFNAKSNKLRITPIAIISPLIYITPAIITAGRQPILILVFTTIILIGFKYKTYLKVLNSIKIKRIVFLFFPLLFVSLLTYLFFISNERDVSTDFESKILLFEVITNSNVTQESIDFLELFGNLKSLVFDAKTYFSHQISMFQIFFDNWQDKLYFGSVQFGYISRRFPIEWGFNKETAYLTLLGIAQQTNTYTNVWRTIFGEYIMDFGFVGSLIIFSFFGFYQGRSFRLYLNYNSPINFSLLLLMCVFSLFSIQASPWAETSWAFPFYWTILIKFLNIKLV